MFDFFVKKDHKRFLNDLIIMVVRRLFRFHFLLILTLVAVTGCDYAANTLKPDRSSGMDFQDYRDFLAPRRAETPQDNKQSLATIPDLQPYVSHSTESIQPMPLVSISVNQSVPLRDVLFELADQAGQDLELDPSIRGSIIFTARNRPFDEVIKRISEMAGLRYKFENGVLRVEEDTPYNKTYKIDYLSYIRTSSGSIRNSVQVLSGDGADSGSAFQASSESESDFWGELEIGLAQILGEGQSGSMRTTRDPRITATEQNPDVQPVAPVSEDGRIQVQPPDAVLRVDSLPVDEDDVSRGGSSSENPFAPTFTINRQAGLINVYASERSHKEVGEYLRLVKRAITSQVLIEAKILEITLNDEFATGIDWRLIDPISSEWTFNFLTNTGAATLNGLNPSTRVFPGTNFAPNTSSPISIGFAGNDIQGLITAISAFGAVKALASPRMTVLNNQSAVLNVATNRVFFEIDIETSQVGDGIVTNTTSEIRNVPEGVLVNVQPSINLEDRTINLALRPTITSIIGEGIQDPAVAVDSRIPEVNVQEIDTVIQVRSGQPVVMGGLLQDRAATQEEGVPLISEVPVLGSLFKQHTDLVRKTELVIFLQATILDSPGDSIHNTDRDLYRAFSGDRRPFRM